MYAEKAVVRVHGELKVQTRFYPHPTSNSTIILVNGSLATCASFSQALRFLNALFNVVLFDQPYSGGSRAHNHELPLLDMEDEALILLDLIEHFRADQVMSFSWGGVSTLLAMAQRPARVQRAVISSFSPVLNGPMLDYLMRGEKYMAAGDRLAIATLVNETLGKHLPHAIKRSNFEHISALDEHEYAQMQHHIRQILNLGTDRFMHCVGNVDVPLLFLNGERDEYTTPTDALYFADLARRSEYVTIRHTGHYMEQEHKSARQDVRQAIERFLLAESNLARLRKAS
ncbi:MAG: alpha/beta hydrolase [Pseudomonas sp.]